MRLSEPRLDRLAGQIVDALAELDDVRLRADDAKLLHAVKAIVTDELQVEERIDAEARDLLEHYRNDIAAGRLDYHELFRKIKARLIQEHHAVL
jgi:hypothetical protein